MSIKIRNDVSARLMEAMGGDDSIVAAARVSTIGVRSESYLGVDAEESSGLINYLMRNRHGTPFEHNAMTFLVEAPIAVFREFHRHRIGWSYNEESGRYKQLEPVFYIPGEDRNLVQQGKPGEYYFIPGTPAQYKEMQDDMATSFATSYATYARMLHHGIAKEVARGVLPVYIFSSMYATCNARSLMAFLSLRTKDVRSTFPSFPMREIEMVAEQMEATFAELLPITYAAFCKHGRVCP
jgi:thymidylate synthase (FAD)